MNTIDTIWRGYEAAVVPPEAGEAQRFDTRQAFFAGATAIFQLLTGPMATLSDDAACVMLDRLKAEIDRNVAAVREAAYGRPN